MAKKQKEETPNVNATANRDIVQRLNFLYQASTYLQSIAPVVPVEKASCKGKERQIVDEKHDERDDSMAADQHVLRDSKKSRSKKTRRKVQMRNTGDLGRSYVHSMRIVGQKTTVKMDPSLKRSLCSGCNTTLVPGSSATIRVKKSTSHGHVVLHTCLHCRTTKRIPAPPNTVTAAPPDSGEHERSLPDIPPIQPEVSPQEKPANPRKKQRTRPRPLPLFARPDAGHVVFRGNERLVLDKEGGLGTCFI